MALTGRHWDRWSDFPGHMIMSVSPVCGRPLLGCQLPNGMGFDRSAHKDDIDSFA